MNRSFRVIAQDQNETPTDNYMGKHFQKDNGFFINWIIVDELATDALIGTNAFQALGLIINTQENTITVGDKTIYYGNAIKTMLNFLYHLRAHFFLNVGQIQTTCYLLLLQISILL